MPVSIVPMSDSSLNRPPPSQEDRMFGWLVAVVIVSIGTYLLLNRARETFPCPAGTFAAGEISGSLASGIAIRLIIFGILLLVVGAKVASKQPAPELPPERKPRISFKLFIRLWMAAGVLAFLSGGAMWFEESRSYYCATSEGIQLRPVIGNADDIKWANVRSVLPQCRYSRSRNFQPSQLILSVSVDLPKDRSIRIFTADMAATYERISDLTANTPVIFDLSQTKRCPPAWQKIFAAGAE